MSDEQKNTWQTLNKREIYDNPWINVNEHQVINPAGNPGIYGVVHYKNLAISILPIDSKGFTYIVGQYRYVLGQYSWEIPEGGGSLKLPPQEEAARELLEETGLSAKKWTYLGELFLSNSVSDERAVMFLAQELTQGEAMPEDTEDLQVKYIHFDELLQMAMDGKIADALAVTTIFKVQLLRVNNQLDF